MSGLIVMGTLRIAYRPGHSGLGRLSVIRQDDFLRIKQLMRARSATQPPARRNPRLPLEMEAGLREPDLKPDFVGLREPAWIDDEHVVGHRGPSANRAAPRHPSNSPFTLAVYSIVRAGRFWRVSASRPISLEPWKYRTVQLDNRIQVLPR